MRVVVQRVTEASIIINQKPHSSINQGLLCFVGFSNSDTKEDFVWSINKIIKMKLFENNSSIEDINGELLVVSQFTLFASIKKGTKPSWSRASKPHLAEMFYNEFVNICKDKTANKTQTGIFGSDMKVKSINDGPVTIIIDTKNKE